MEQSWLAKYRSGLASIDTVPFSWVGEGINKNNSERNQYWPLACHVLWSSQSSYNISSDSNILDAKIAIMALPAHTSHKLQALDMSVFNSLKFFYALLSAWVVVGIFNSRSKTRT